MTLRRSCLDWIDLRTCDRTTQVKTGFSCVCVRLTELCGETEAGLGALQGGLSPVGHSLDLHTVAPVGPQTVQVHKVLPLYTHTDTQHVDLTNYLRCNMCILRTIYGWVSHRIPLLSTLTVETCLKRDNNY